MWHANPDVLVTDLGDELILLHPGQNEMFSLNFTSRDLWLALPATPETLAQHLTDLYGITAEQARADVQTVMDDLSRRELVQPNP